MIVVFDSSDKAFINLDWEMSDPGNELKIYTWYLGHMEETFNNQREEFAEKSIQAHDRMAVDGSGNSYYDYVFDMLDSFIKIHRKSTFVSIYSFLEKTLIDECKSRKEKNGQIQLNLNDLYGQSDIDKVKVYFAKVLQEPFPADAPEWQDIQNYKSFRNCLVHAGGRLNEMRSSQEIKKLSDFVAGSRYLDLDQWGNEVEIKAGFCEEVAQQIANFLRAWLYPHTLRSQD